MQKKYNTLLALLALWLPLASSAQKHDNIWLYGQQSSNPLVKVTKIDFSGGVPSFQPTELEGSFVVFTSSMSDSAGNLLFYTNGCHLYDASGKIMAGGDTLNGPANDYWNAFCKIPTGPSYKVTHGAFALPLPDTVGIYYLFHARASIEDYSLTSLQYTKIDMNTPDELGRVIEKNVFILENDYFEPAAAVRHGNGRDWWIVAPNAQTSSPVLYRFLLTPEGISGPFEQHGAFEVIDSLFTGGAQVLLFTPDGSKLIQYHYYYGFIAYDFDRCTGLISNPVKVLSPVKYPTWEGLDMEVSANSRFAYVIMGGQKKLVQYDLQAPDVAASGDTVAVYDGFTYNQNPTAFGWLERAPNGKIYMAGCCYYLHVIESPDLPGALCNVQQHSVELPTWIYGSLPYFPNYRLYDAPGSPCDTLGINTPVSATGPPPASAPGLAISAYPNPARGLLRVEAHQGRAPYVAQLLDAYGREQLRQELPDGQAHNLGLAGLPAGLYRLVVTDAEGARGSAAIVVE